MDFCNVFHTLEHIWFYFSTWHTLVSKRQSLDQLRHCTKMVELEFERKVGSRCHIAVNAMLNKDVWSGLWYWYWYRDWSAYLSYFGNYWYWHCITLWKYGNYLYWYCSVLTTFRTCTAVPQQYFCFPHIIMKLVCMF